MTDNREIKIIKHIKKYVLGIEPPSNGLVMEKMENLGKEELYCEWFRCPNCKDSNVRRGFRYCPNCGFDLINYRWGDKL